ncbi:MAG: class II aldolase/adducin family protein [Chloroflexota bacterium]
MLKAYKNLTLAIVNLVNAPRGQTYSQYRDKLLLKPEPRQQLIEIAQRVITSQLAQSTHGELSLRLPSDSLAITARDSALDRLAETDIITCSMVIGKSVGLAPRHLDWHRLIYNQTAAQSVLFCQPCYALTLANAGLLPQPRLAVEIFESIANVTLLPMDDLFDTNLAKTVTQHHTVLIPQFGALVWGHSLVDVLGRAGALEYVSQLTSIAYQTGLGPKYS